MALKECPACREMIRGSAERCRKCGHAFDQASIVKNKPATRCPLCGQVVDAGAAACDCGYDFATRPVDVRAQLLRRKKYGWFWLGVGVFAVLAAGGLWLVKVLLPGVLVAVAGAGLIGRGLHALSYTR